MKRSGHIIGGRRRPIKSSWWRPLWKLRRDILEQGESKRKRSRIGRKNKEETIVVNLIIYISDTNRSGMEVERWVGAQYYYSWSITYLVIEIELHYLYLYCIFKLNLTK